MMAELDNEKIVRRDTPDSWDRFNLKQEIRLLRVITNWSYHVIPLSIHSKQWDKLSVMDFLGKERFQSRGCSRPVAFCLN